MGEKPASGFKGLKLHNTLTRTKDDFRPIDPSHVRMYVCGPTVYDDAHIGNARPAIVFDVLYRLLRHLYGAGHVTYARNITDVDDKINARAAEDHPDLPLNEAIAKVTAETEAQYHADVKALGCLEPTFEPRATAHIAEMVAMIGTLIAKNNAYAAEGHVLFDVKSWKNAAGEAEYGKLSRRPLDEMIAGARVEVAPYKRDPMDFVLWKPSSGGEPGWDSPWGRGRPGWHLECSAMSEKLLGTTFDIHGGGIDLVFPHHENEIAQSRCAHGTEVMAKYWVHNGFLQVEGEKMAKSAGNFVTIRELLETEKFGQFMWPGEVVRYAMLKTQYRQPMDFSVGVLEEASTELSRFWYHTKGADEPSKPSPKFVTALCDDLNTPSAIAELHRLAGDKVYAKELSAGEEVPDATTALASATQSAAQLVANLKLIGIDISNYDPDWPSKSVRQELISEIEKKIDERLDFIRQKNWPEADCIRDELAAKGIQLKDSKDPQTGERVTKWEPTWEVKR